MMNYFYPHAMAQRVYQITPQLLKSWGVKGLILDIDNTLTTHDNPIPDAGVDRNDCAFQQQAGACGAFCKNFGA